MVKKFVMLFAVLSIFASANKAIAFTITVEVPGTSSLWLAGMPDGSSLGFDSVPAQSAIQVPNIPLIAGSVLTFQSTGGARRDPRYSFFTPDGEPNLAYHVAANGISDLYAPFVSLIGVFLGNNQPNLSIAPVSLGENLNYSILAPTLQQSFFIGDGLDLSGTQQSIVVPTGATRLFLSAMDCSGWYNNGGIFTVDVTGTTPTPVPEPSTFLLISAGLIGIGVIRRRTK